MLRNHKRKRRYVQQAQADPVGVGGWSWLSSLSALFGVVENPRVPSLGCHPPHLHVPLALSTALTTPVVNNRL
jgi:hypothetical protein